MKMIIGIDFDNTIANYNHLFEKVAYNNKFIKNKFYRSKNSVKKILLDPNTNAGIKKWQTIQGQVYGKYMNQAKVYSGLNKFLIYCKYRKVKVFIISHKSKFGHFDKEKISLRKEAVKWLEKKHFFNKDKLNINKKNVFFLNTREKKIKKIIDLKCTHHIDDLTEIFSHKDFPNKVNKILITNNKYKSLANDINIFNNWFSISNFFFGSENQYIVKQYLHFHYKKNYIKNVKKIKGQRNSNIYKIKTSDNKNMALKMYPNIIADKRPRLKTEFKAVSYMHKNGIVNVPKPILNDYSFNFALYEWIEGKKILKPNRFDIEELFKYVIKLQNISKNTKYSLFSKASESCVDIINVIKQIDKRLIALEIISKSNLLLYNFIEKKFKPILKKEKEKFLHNINKYRIPTKLDKKFQILSSADLGFHNALKVSNNNIFFIDFDYFGWDDPVKQTSDFIWHPGMKNSNILIKKWLKLSLFVFNEDKNFRKRLKFSHALFGLRWIMIILKEFLPEIQSKRIESQQLSPEKIMQLQKIQLIKANHIYKKLANNLKFL